MTEEMVKSIPRPDEGVLLGVVLDLSDSMRKNMQNSRYDQISRIESLSHAFRSVVSDAGVLLQGMMAEKVQTLRMFVYGFGFQAEKSPLLTSGIGDVFSILSNLEIKVEHYKLLQPELERVWTTEVKQMLKQAQVQGNAKEGLKDFVSQELKEQAIQAEQQRSIAKFQNWCASVCVRIDTYSRQMKIQAAQYKKLALVAIPIITGLQWLLRCPMLIMAFLNKLFEALLQRKLTMLQVNADQYASKQAAKVVSLTQTALAGYHSKIFNAVERAVLEFFDKEAFKVIHFYDLQGSVDVI